MKSLVRLLIASSICFIVGQISQGIIKELGLLCEGEGQAILLFAFAAAFIAVFTSLVHEFWIRESSDLARFLESLLYLVPVSLGMISSEHLFGGTYPFLCGQYLHIIIVFSVMATAIFRIFVPSSEADHNDLHTCPPRTVPARAASPQSPLPVAAPIIQMPAAEQKAAVAA